MSDRKAKWLVVIFAIILLMSGVVLFLVFERQGMRSNKENKYVNYSVNDYVEIAPVIFDEYNDVYSNINVSKVSFKNLDANLTRSFLNSEEEIINYIIAYYNEISSNKNSSAISTVFSTIKTQINGAVLSVFYRLDFELDEKAYSDNIKTYFITINIDLGTNKILDNSDLLSKYSYNRSYIADKLFNEEILVQNGQVVIDKDTNISITKNDIERKKSSYVDRIINEFDNIIEMYIENNSLVLVYNSEELKNIFFDNKFDTNIKFKYLN